ncbi:MAG: DUF3617 domain-containing protein [Polaromonas sp.]|nr:DUF3617 domain-containing protein [Polaromonas sp.]
MNLRFVMCAAAMGLAAASAGAQSMKPGLWETTTRMGGSPEMDQAMARMQQQMAGMPPERRKQMQSIMDKQGVSAGAGGMTARMCITREMIDRGQLPTRQQDSCKTAITDKTSRGMKMNFTCTNPPSSGDAVYAFQGDQAYTMNMKINSTAKGAPRQTTMDTSGKWLGDDCGAIKPFVFSGQ